MYSIKKNEAKYLYNFIDSQIIGAWPYLTPHALNERILWFVCKFNDFAKNGKLKTEATEKDGDFSVSITGRVGGVSVNFRRKFGQNWGRFVNDLIRVVAVAEGRKTAA